MKRLALVLALILATPAAAQDYVPPDRELWEAMKRALGDEVNAPAAAHAKIQQIIQTVEQQAAIRAAQRKPKPD